MSVATKCGLLAAACALCAGSASAGVVLDFEGLKDDEPVQNFYNGGAGGLGSAGTNYGVAFGADAVAVVRVHPFPGDPSPPTVLELDSLNPSNEGQPLTMTMNVSAGFKQQLNFWDIAILRAASVTIWSGQNGGGTMLAQMSLPLVPVNNEVFTGAVSMPFAGTAGSVVFAGGDQQLVIEDISFGPLPNVPEPRQWWYCAAIGLLWLCRVHARRRGDAPPSGIDP